MRAATQGESRIAIGNPEVTTKVLVNGVTGLHGHLVLFTSLLPRNNLATVRSESPSGVGVKLDFGSGLTTSWLRHRGKGYNRENHMFPPGSQQSLQFSFPTSRISPWDPSTPPPPVKASATFSVSFVEFSDGSTYGGSKWGKSLPDARRLRYIQQLEEAYDNGGEQALKSALSSLRVRKGDPEATIGKLWRLERTLNASGVSALIAEMDDFLAAAEEHANIEMK